MHMNIQVVHSVFSSSFYHGGYRSSNSGGSETASVEEEDLEQKIEREKEKHDITKMVHFSYCVVVCVCIKIGGG